MLWKKGKFYLFKLATREFNLLGIPLNKQSEHVRNPVSSQGEETGHGGNLFLSESFFLTEGQNYGCMEPSSYFIFK